MVKHSLSFYIIFAISILMLCIASHGFAKVIGKKPQNRVCSDFDTYAQAKKAFDKDPVSFARLDGDSDGEPCESLKRKIDRI